MFSYSTINNVLQQTNQRMFFYIIYTYAVTYADN